MPQTRGATEKSAAHKKEKKALGFGMIIKGNREKMMRRENSEDEQPPPPEQPRAQEEIAGSFCSPHVLRVADFSHERAAAERDGLDSTRSSCSSKRELEPASASEELQLASGAASASDTLAAPPPSKRQQSWGATSLERALPEAVDEEQGQGHEHKHALKARAGADLAHAAAGAADAAGEGVQVFRAEWDAEGVYFYQAFSDEIAEWALREQRLGGPKFNETRMTWIKPSFAWVLYRSGYGRKHRQERILKLKLPHFLVAELLCDCACKHGGGGSKGRVQWDPGRDLMSSEGKGREPRRLLRERAIQIGLSRDLSERYVAGALSIADVSDLARRVGAAHGSRDERKVKAAMAELVPQLPVERPYMPSCSHAELVRLGLAMAGPGE